MDILIKAVIAFISALGFSIMFNLPRKLLFHAGVTGSLAFVTYTIVMNYSGDYIIASLLGSVVVGVMGQIFASITKHPSTLFTVPGIIPLVPGYALYNAMFYLVNENSLLVKKSIEANLQTTEDYKNVSESVHKIIDQVKKIEDIANINSNSISEVAEASSHLSKVTYDLDSELGKFQV